MPNLRFAAPKERRSAIITGAALGIGRACAMRLAEEGRDVVVSDILPEGEAVAAEIRAMGGSAVFIPADAADESSVRDLADQTMKLFGRADILVCCAGLLGSEKPFLDHSPAEFERIMRVNVNGVYYAHHAVIPYMLERGWGRTVVMTSGAREGSPNLVPYSMSKGAVYSFVRAMGGNYARQGVLVNGVEPGRALTRMIIPRFTEEQIANPPGTPIGRFSDAEEVAEVVEFLTSERNTYTTGSVWSIKGGAG